MIKFFNSIFDPWVDPYWDIQLRLLWFYKDKGDRRKPDEV